MSASFPRGHRSWWLALPVALLLLVVACTGDGASTSTPVSPAATLAPTPAPTATVEATPASTAFTVTDSAGTAVHFESHPQRIVSHSPAVTEILFAIGAGGQVIAADQFSTYPPETERLERVAYSDPDPERAVALEPDLIIFSGRQRNAVQQFRDLGLTVYFAEEPGDIDGVLASIERYGVITGQEAAAAALVAEMRQRLATLEERLAAVDQGPRVFYEITDSLYTVSPASFIGGMLARLKLQNIAAGAETAFPQLSNEAIVERDPEVILLADEAAGVTPEGVASRPGWSSISAIRDGRVFIVDPDRGSRPGPRLVEAMEEWAALVYPELFP